MVAREGFCPGCQRLVILNRDGTCKKPAVQVAKDWR